MEAFHSFWTEPGRCRNGGAVFFPDYEQLTAILSAAQWRKHSGRVRMITDTEGAFFFRESGLDAFWDEVDVLLDPLKGEVDPIAFWAAGKLYALRNITLPCVMLDTDLIVWKNVDARLLGDAVAAHAEPLHPGTYPDPAVFHFRNSYRFPVEWDFNLNAANTAFLYLGDTVLRDAYTDAAIRFLRSVETAGMDPVQTMCFAEQRILPMCAAAEGKNLSFLMQPEEVPGQDFVTHTWGFKQILRSQPRAREEFCMRLVRRIALEHPDQADRLADCRDLKAYYARYLAGSQIT